MLAFDSPFLLIFVSQGTHDEICQFVSKAEFNGANEKFTFFEKSDVNGANVREVYTFLKESLPKEDGATDVGWNFEIFLVGKTGIPAKRFEPSRKVYDCLKPELEKLFAE
jgi:glutathione peroxidase-family protein